LDALYAKCGQITMPMTHGFGDAEDKLTGQLDPLHPAFSGHFTAYSGILGRGCRFSRPPRLNYARLELPETHNRAKLRPIGLGSTTMRLAVISDIHGNLAALEAVLADIKARGVDRTVNLGDCVTSPLWPKETFEALEALSLPTVRGNHDRWIEEFPDDKLTSAGLFAMGSWPATARPTTIRHACWKKRSTTAASYRHAATCWQCASRVSRRRAWCCVVIATARPSFTDLMTVWFSIQGALVARSSQTFPLPQTWNTARRTRDMQSSRSDKGAGRPNSWPSNTIGTPHRPVPSPTTTRNGRGPYRRDMSNSCWHRST
jgi:hypothetical protein